MRHTEVTPEELQSDKTLQEKLNYFWRLIENEYEEEWRVELSGAVNLQVDEVMLERILRDHAAEARMYFGASEEHNPEFQQYEWYHFPEYLIGLYSIEGIYNNNQALVNGPRSYYFEQDY